MSDPDENKRKMMIQRRVGPMVDWLRASMRQPSLMSMLLPATPVEYVVLEGAGSFEDAALPGRPDEGLMKFRRDCPEGFEVVLRRTEETEDGIRMVYGYQAV